MHDENVACRDLGQVLFEYAVGCFGTSQLKRATRFPNVPTRALHSFLSVQYSRQAYNQAYFKHSFIPTCCVFPHTTMTPVTFRGLKARMEPTQNFEN